MSEKNKVVELGAWNGTTGAPYRSAAGSAPPPIEPPEAVGRLVSYCELDTGNTAMYVILPPKKGWWRRKKPRAMTVMGHSVAWVYARCRRIDARLSYKTLDVVKDPEVIGRLSTLWVDRETLTESRELLNED